MLCVVGMSAIGYQKAQLTKAANLLRNKIANVDSTILSNVVPTGDPSADYDLVSERKRSIATAFSSINRAVSELSSRWSKAQDFGCGTLDENGESPLLEELQAHWETNGMESLMEEAYTLLDRLDAAAKALPTLEALIQFAGYSGSTHSAPNSNIISTSPLNTSFANNPNSSTPRRLAQETRAELASRSPLRV